MTRREEDARAAVADWNEKYPCGTAVVLKRGNQDFYTITSSEAYVLGDNPMIEVAGVTGVYQLDRVRAIREAA